MYVSLPPAYEERSKAQIISKPQTKPHTKSQHRVRGTTSTFCLPKMNFFSAIIFFLIQPQTQSQTAGSLTHTRARARTHTHTHTHTHTTTTRKRADFVLSFSYFDFICTFH